MFGVAAQAVYAVLARVISGYGKPHIAVVLAQQILQIRTDGRSGLTSMTEFSHCPNSYNWPSCPCQPFSVF
jgi:hypothetical protein